ncbi:beta-galactosidase [Bacteroides reticulotermitis JCM 10512]|uniref:Beta-galactosidase n=1 Tax=Bacteroides reticulotermitis JCM 10512 TaxID=1445607 RepID=W4URI1_9BACE|nr:beta-galactosidase [Bacteroides reticulotermitis JCM 10512]
MKIGKKLIISMLLLTALAETLAGQQLITNVYGRDIRSLNGKWNAIIDLYDQGRRMNIYENQQPKGTTDFFEYAFEGGLRLNVPGDWNSQATELKYYEGTVWYARHFDAGRLADSRQFLYFGAVSYRCTIYLNGKEIGAHEGGFTPFHLEVTDQLKDGDNFLVVEVNNRRTKDAIPALAFDWWNYGGITRDVLLVRTARTFVEDYFIQLDKNAPDRIVVKVRLSDKKAGEQITVLIPELKINALLTLMPREKQRQCSV